MALFGRFKFLVENKITGLTSETKWMANLVLNSAFTLVSSSSSSVTWRIELGTGSAPPTIADNALEAFLVKRTATSSGLINGASTSFSSPVYSTSNGFDFVFSLGAVVGNLSEIGLSLNDTLVTRALITDELGDPTTITVGANDILTVKYLIGYDIDTSHPPGVAVVDFDGQAINLSAKWCNIGLGAANKNGMNNGVFPLHNINNGERVWIVETLPSDPLSNISGGTTPISFLNSVSGIGISNFWQLGMVATGSSWTKTISYTSVAGSNTGNWNGFCIGADGANAGSIIALFEFDSTFIKLANQQVTISVTMNVLRG